MNHDVPLRRFEEQAVLRRHALAYPFHGPEELNRVISIVIGDGYTIFLQTILLGLPVLRLGGRNRVLSNKELSRPNAFHKPDSSKMPN
jgi:hypothetical protein